MKKFSVVILLLALLIACQPAQTATPGIPQQPAEQQNAGAQFVINPPAGSNPTPIPKPGSPSGVVPEVKTFNVEAFQFGYEPSEIHVKKGDRVHIHLTTRDVSHSFTIRQFKVSIPASPGLPGDGEFIADTAGSFRWRCSIPCGSGHSDMSGTLVVE